MSGLLKWSLLIGCFISLGSCASHSRTATLLDHQNAGDTAFINGNYGEAEKHYKAQLAEAEKSGGENAMVRIALHYLGLNYMAWGKYVEAEAAYNRQIAVAEKVYGAESPEMFTPLTDITWLYLKQGCFKDAEVHNKRAWMIINKLPPGEHKEDLAVIESQKELIEQNKN